jgi:inorganic pyrophosphatase
LHPAPLRTAHQSEEREIVTSAGDEGGEFWTRLEELAATSAIKIDRPRGSAHPRFPEFVYPVDYGYLTGTQGGDGEGIDVWRGTELAQEVTGVACTVDPFKRNAELKILLGCTAEEVDKIREFYRNQPQAAMIHLQP